MTPRYIIGRVLVNLNVKLERIELNRVPLSGDVTAAETVAATSSRCGTVTTFVGATLALPMTSVQCAFLFPIIRM